MRRVGSRAASVVVLAAVVLVGPACGVRDLSFVQDDRVHDLRPRPGELVRLPFDLTWSTRGFDGRFAVFFDTAPMKPGQGLDALVPKDDPCRTEPTCPDVAWLAERGVFVTEEGRLRIETLPDRRKNNRSKDRHEVVVVLLDGDSTRVGESTFVREFVVERED